LAERRAESTTAACRPRSGFPGAGLIDSEWTSLERLIIELLNCRLCLFGVCEFYERKATLSSSLAVERDGHIRKSSDSRKMLTDFVFRCVVREIPDKKTD